MKSVIDDMLETIYKSFPSMRPNSLERKVKDFLKTKKCRAVKFQRVGKIGIDVYFETGPNLYGHQKTTISKILPDQGYSQEVLDNLIYSRFIREFDNKNSFDVKKK